MKESSTLEKSIPLATTCGALGGCIYAQLANLPAAQVVKAWAIWSVAHQALVTLAETFIEHSVTKRIVACIISIATTAIGIHLLQKRNLIGQQMAVCIAIMQVIYQTFQFVRMNRLRELERQLNLWVAQEGGCADEAAERIKEAFESSEEMLDLSFLNLRTLPPCIGFLENLTALNLPHNRACLKNI